MTGIIPGIPKLFSNWPDLSGTVLILQLKYVSEIGFVTQLHVKH